MLVFRKPIEQATIAAQVLATGTGGLNIDATRITTADSLMGGAYSGGVRPNSAMGATGEVGGTSSMLEEGGGRLSPREFKQPFGRWPPNLLLVHAEACKVVGSKKVKAPVINRFDDGMKPFGNGAGHPYTSEQTGDADGMEEIPVYECEDGCPVKLLDEQSGVLKSGDPSNSVRNEGGNLLLGKGKGVPLSGFGDTGGASRFFGQIQPDAPFFYTGKVSRKERNAGIAPETFVEGFVTLKEGLSEEDLEKVMSEWPEHMASPDEHPCLKTEVPEGLLSFFEDVKPDTNTHPTLKPINLMKWLIKLVAPKGAVVLDPYCGSGSTCIAALEADCDYIGIERDPVFHDIATRRIAAIAPTLEAGKAQRAAFDAMDDLPQED